MGWGSSTERGGGQKVRYVFQNPGETKLFAGISRGFRRDIPGVPEKFEKKKVCVHFSFPKFEDTQFRRAVRVRV